MSANNEIDDYRVAVLQEMLATTDKDGTLLTTETEAKNILESFTDDDIKFGMPFNTPRETALMLLGD